MTAKKKAKKSPSRPATRKAAKRSAAKAAQKAVTKPAKPRGNAKSAKSGSAREGDVVYSDVRRSLRAGLIDRLLGR